MEKNTQAANEAILIRQAEIQSCSNGNTEYCSAGDGFAQVYKTYKENEEEISGAGSKILDLLELLEGVKLPFISYMIDLEAQEKLDADKPYSADQKAVRSHVVAMEG
jgi:hypothetical protein